MTCASPLIILRSVPTLGSIFSRLRESGFQILLLGVREGSRAHKMAGNGAYSKLDFV